MDYRHILHIIDIILIIIFYGSIILTFYNNKRFKLYIFFCIIGILIATVRSLECYFIDSIVWVLFSGLYLYAYNKLKTNKI